MQVFLVVLWHMDFSFGLPNRHTMNSVFLAIAIGAGMTSAIMHPLHEPEMAAVMGANVVMNKDLNCTQWIKKFRSAEPEGTRSRRSGRRRNQAAV